MTNSYDVLKTEAPFELTSRYLAAYIDVNKLNCLDFAKVAAPDDTKKQTAICGSFNF